ncbi:hypothetical protein D3C86_315030 [compost metagenome]
MRVAVGLHALHAGGVAVGVVLGAEAGPRHAAGTHLRGAAVGIDEVELAQRAATVDGAAPQVLRLRPARAIIARLHQVGRQPVAAAFHPVRVAGERGLEAVAAVERTTQVTEGVLAQRTRARTVVLVQVGDAGEGTGEAVAVGVGGECGRRHAGVLGLVGVVVGGVAAERPALQLGDEPGGEVIVADVAAAVDPVVDLRGRRADPGAGVPAEQAGVIAHVVLARIVVAAAHHHAQALFGQRIAGEEVERAAERFVGARGDVGGALADFDGFQVQGVDVAVGQRAATVTGATIGQAVDGGADLLGVAVGDEAAHADLGTPHRRTGGVGLADHHAGQFVERVVDAAQDLLPVEGFLAHRGLGIAGGLADHLHLVERARVGGGGGSGVGRHRLHGGGEQQGKQRNTGAVAGSAHGSGG